MQFGQFSLLCGQHLRTDCLCLLFPPGPYSAFLLSLLHPHPLPPVVYFSFIARVILFNKKAGYSTFQLSISRVFLLHFKQNLYLVAVFMKPAASGPFWPLLLHFPPYLQPLHTDYFLKCRVFSPLLRLSEILTYCFTDSGLCLPYPNLHSKIVPHHITFYFFFYSTFHCLKLLYYILPALLPHPPQNIMRVGHLSSSVTLSQPSVQCCETKQVLSKYLWKGRRRKEKEGGKEGRGSHFFKAHFQCSPKRKKWNQNCFLLLTTHLTTDVWGFPH